MEQKITTATLLRPPIRAKLEEWADKENRSLAAQIAVILEKAIEEREQAQAQPTKKGKA